MRIAIELHWDYQSETNDSILNDHQESDAKIELTGEALKKLSVIDVLDKERCSLSKNYNTMWKIHRRILFIVALLLLYLWIDELNK